MEIMQSGLRPNAAPEAVVFDLGKVLLDFDYSKVAQGMAPYCALPFEVVLKQVNQSAALHRFETGLLSAAEFFNEVRTGAHFEREFEIFEPIFADMFTPVPEMIELNHKLRAAGIPTYIFSNTNEIAVKHIRRAYPFFSDFTGYIFSFEHRSMKPDSKIYEVVERVTGLSGKELLYIDDRLENIEHGIERGWRTIHHVDPRETIRQTEHFFKL
jgi:putative hydrolase of the HAD superfamily